MKKKNLFLLAIVVMLMLGDAAWACEHKRQDNPEQNTARVYRQGRSHGNRLGGKGKRKYNKNKRRHNATAPHKSVANGKHSPLLDVGIPQGMENKRIDHTAMVVYFNTRYRIPNCVIYDFSATEVLMCDAPDAERRKHYNFAPDPATSASPAGNDYRGSGYDRGHMAPAMDMKWSRTSMTEAFYMTNVCPQNHQLNSNVWRIMEQTIHHWAKRNKRLIIATGPVLGNEMKMIGPRHDIAVPKAFYKVVYAPSQGRGIAFMYNNVTDNGKRSLRSHTVSIDYVERVTGLDFFATLTPQVQASFESQSDYDLWK